MLLVFGSLNVDLLFAVEALPRAGETVLCPGYELAPGGKGANQAAAAAKAGAEVRMAGRTGDDEFGRLVRAALAGAGVDCGLVGLDPRRTGTAVIGVDPLGENQIIVASGANLGATAEQVPDAELRAAGTLLCQNEVPGEATFALVRRARSLGVRTILNLAPASAVPDPVLDAVDVLVVNEVEAAAAAGIGQVGDPADLARDLAKKHDLACIVTLGASGALAIGPDGGHRVTSLEVDAVDTTGAGDAFVGVLAAALDEGLPLERALCRASVAAGLTCLRIGAQSSQPGRAAIEARLADLADLAPFA
ncbi:MAG TPA: ribokinase [Geminicoccaceae bacterium]